MAGIMRVNGNESVIRRVSNPTSPTMENPVSSSWGLHANSESNKTNRIKEAFQKDYETLHKFIDMMKSAEAMSIEEYNDVIIEKHNESVGFMKTAIFQAQNNVFEEVARQREAATKTKFNYMKVCGLKRHADSDDVGAKRSDENDGNSCGSENAARSDPAHRAAPAEGEERTKQRKESSQPIIRSAPNKILNSLRKVASKSIMGDPTRSPKVAPSATETTPTAATVSTESAASSKSREVSNVDPTQAVRVSQSSAMQLTSVRSPDSISKVPVSSAKSRIMRPSCAPMESNPSFAAVSREPATSVKPRNVCGSENVFESLSRSSTSMKARTVATVEPRRSQQLKRPGNQSSYPLRNSMAGPSPPKKPLCLARSYDIGTVVMAKYLKYSYWPAIVVKRPPFSIESENCIYVMFWEGKENKMKTSCADTHFSMVRPWTDREAAQDLVPRNRRRKDWNDSIDLAEEMVLLTKEERFWKMILIEEKFDLETDYRPERDAVNDKGFPQKGDVVVVGRDTFYPGIVTKEEFFFENLNKDLYFINGHLHVSFMEENTHGWYTLSEVWILGKSRGETWPVPTGAPGQKIRHSMEVARNVLKMPREQRFHQVGAFSMQ